MTSVIELRMELGDVTTFEADVLALKYAQEFHGVDQVVAQSLEHVGIPTASLQPHIGQSSFMETNKGIRTTHALFVGVVRLRQFSYAQIREFAAQVLRILARRAPTAEHLAMTIHGAGYGLDEVESCLSQVNGYLDALQAGSVPTTLRRITIVDRNPGRVERLRQALAMRFAQNTAVTVSGSAGGFILSSTPTPAATKPHIFVAMAFGKQLDDVFYYGIQRPVHGAGYVCERMDHVWFTGDIISWLKERIETAQIIIAELSGSNPNVYLEVGYAWGKGRPTILLAPNVGELAFDVQGHRCLIYDSIRDLDEQLTRELAALQTP